MSSLSMLDKRKLEDLFGMSTGWVLDFTDSSFSDFFRTTCNIDIDDGKYKTKGASKAKRLRMFWNIEPDKTVGKALVEMIEIAKHIGVQNDSISNAKIFEDCEAIASRLIGEKLKEKTHTEDNFLKIQFDKINLSSLGLENTIVPVIDNRIKEAFSCRSSNSFLCVVIMCGSILEGLLLGVATKHPKEFNKAAASPRIHGKVKPFYEWKLAEFIDVAYELGILSLDVKKFSHALRDFRNYIHPFEQITSGFNPDEHTADICLQVLKAAMGGISKSKFAAEV